MGALGGSLAEAGLMRGWVPTILRAYLDWMRLMRGGRGMRKDSECTAAKLVEWKQFVTQMPIFRQRVDMAVRVHAGGDKISEP
jgi:hypothetical protein